MLENFKKLIYEICDEEKIAYQSLSKDWIIKLSKEEKIKYIIGSKFPLNDQSISKIISDKYATYCILKELDIPVTDYKIFFTPRWRNTYESDFKTVKDIVKYMKMQPEKKIVIKSNDGSSGKEVFKCSTPAQVKSVINKLFKNKNSISICPFYNIDTEYRLVYLNGNCELIYGKKAAEGAWKNNLYQGASIIQNIENELKEKLVSIANNTYSVLPAEFCSIDIIKTTDGKLYVIEINSTVSLMKYSSFSSENYEQVKEIYKKAIRLMMG